MAVKAVGIEHTKPLVEELQVEIAEQCVRILTDEYDALAARARAEGTTNRLDGRMRKVSLYAARAADFRQSVRREIRNRPALTVWIDWLGRARICADNELLRV